MESISGYPRTSEEDKGHQSSRLDSQRWLTASVTEPHLQLPPPQTLKGSFKRRYGGTTDKEIIDSHRQHDVGFSSYIDYKLDDSQYNNPNSIITPRLGPVIQEEPASILKKTREDQTPILFTSSFVPQNYTQSGNVYSSDVPYVRKELPTEKPVPSNRFPPALTDPLFRYASPDDSTAGWLKQPDSIRAQCDSDFRQYFWQLHQQNPSQPLVDVVRFHGFIDQCLSHDGKCLQIDEFLASVPVGSYLSTDQLFKLQSVATDTDQLDYGCKLPVSLSSAILQSSASRKLLCGSIPNLETFWYVNGKSVFLWKWNAPSSDQQLELYFNDPVVAVGAVDPKPFFLRTEDDSSTLDDHHSKMCKILLIATTTQMSLWILRIPPDATSIFEATSSSFICPSPKYQVTVIVGHDPSGRLFYGDDNGGIYEFVFLPSGPTNPSWMSSFLHRLGAWNKESLSQQRTTSEQVVGPSVISKVLGRWAGGRHSVVSLTFDHHRSLLYSVDVASNIDLFFLPPPDVSETGFTEHSLTPIASLSHSQTISEMTAVYRQLIRSSQDHVPSPQPPPLSIKALWGYHFIEQCNIVQVVPLGRHEGSTVAAVALSNDGCRLFLRLRLDLPLLPKRLETTYNPEIANYQYVKAIDVLNWKPPPTLYTADNKENNAPQAIFNPGVATNLFYNNRTFLSTFNMKTDDCSSSVVVCITPDESDIYNRQIPAGGRRSVLNTPKTLREWWQPITIDTEDCHVFAIYEQPLDSDYHQLLESYGPLPDPFNTVGRIRAEHRIRQREKERAKIGSTLIDSNIKQQNRQSIGKRGGRTSISPWDVSPFVDPQSNPVEAALGLGQISSCQKYIPPQSLHSLSATSTLPARVFVILTNKGVFLLQQQRFSDLFKNAALNIIESNEQNQQQSQIDIIKDFCSPPSQTEFQYVQSIISPDVRSSVSTTPKLSLLNVYAATHLFPAEQVMAAIWQTLTGLYGKLPWPSSTHNKSRLGVGDFSASLSTPFNRRDRLSSTYRSTKRSTTPGLHNKPSSSSILVSTRQAFPWAFLLEVLVTIMTNPTVHNDPTFKDSLYSSISQSSGLAQSNLELPFNSPLTSTRVQGLLLYMSRILRPFWSTSIFESAYVHIGESLENLIMTCPGVYRRSQFEDKAASQLFGTQSDLEEATNKKRKRTESNIQLVDSPSDQKRTKYCEEQRPRLCFRSSSQPPEAIALTSRFSVQEFNQTRSWLDRLEGVVVAIMGRLPNSSSAENPMHEAQQINDDVKSLKSLALLCKIASQTLYCCSLLLNVTDGRELPSDTFDLLVDASLRDLICSPAHRNVLRNLLTRQILPPHVLKVSCDWIFSQADLDLQCSIQPLKLLHQSIYQYRWQRMVQFPECTPIERNAVFRSKEVQEGIRALLSAAGWTPSVLEIGPIIILLAELQLFDILADFIARLAESLIAQQIEVQRNVDTNAVDAPSSYMSNRLFRNCLEKYYVYLEDLLDHYQAVSQITNGSVGRDVALDLVKSCLSLDIPSYETSMTSGALLSQSRGRHPSSTVLPSSVIDPFSTSREWLHFIVLDWINECGQRTFPLPLKSVSSPVYAVWIGYHKEEIGDNALNILSEFLLNNHEYNEFATFLIGVASKRWPEPRSVLDSIFISNFSEISFPTTTTDGGISSISTDASMVSLISLERHATRVIGCGVSSCSMENLKPMSDLWNTIVNYLGVTQGGMNLSARLRFLIQAKVGLKDGIKLLEEKNSSFINPVLNNTNASIRQLSGLSVTVDHLINMVELQVSLLRESIEVAIFLLIHSPDEDCRKAFSSDYSCRKTFMEQLHVNNKNRNTRIRNIQALMYLLQWRLWECPSKIMESLNGLVDAVTKDDFPVPGLCFLACPSLGSGMVEEKSSFFSSRISDAVFCRSGLAVKLGHPELLVDFVSKYLLMILVAQQQAVHDRDYPRRVVDDSDKHSMLTDTLLKGIPFILSNLHGAAYDFRTAYIRKTLRLTDNSPPWEFEWWKWPMHVIRRQLTIADNFIGANEEGELDEQNQLPILRILIDSYQKMIPDPSRPVDLHDSHIWILLFDIKESWLQQLIGMSSSLPFIHLLDDDERERSLAPADLESSCRKPLLDMFRRAPSKVQGLYNKCSDAIRGCQTAVKYCKDWFLTNSSTIDDISEAGPSQDTAARLNYCTNIRASSQLFLSSLDRLQHRIPILIQYQAILQRLGSSCPSTPVTPRLSSRSGNRLI